MTRLQLTGSKKAGFKLLVDGVEITRAQSVTIDADGYGANASVEVYVDELDVDLEDVDVTVSGQPAKVRSVCGDIIPPF